MLIELLKEGFFEEAKRIEEEIQNVDFEAEYGLTPEKSQKIKERIYQNIRKEIERRKDKSN